MSWLEQAVATLDSVVQRGIRTASSWATSRTRGRPRQSQSAGSGGLEPLLCWMATRRLRWRWPPREGLMRWPRALSEEASTEGSVARVEKRTNRQRGLSDHWPCGLELVLAAVAAAVEALRVAERSSLETTEARALLIDALQVTLAVAKGTGLPLSVVTQLLGDAPMPPAIALGEEQLGAVFCVCIRKVVFCVFVLVRVVSAWALRVLRSAVVSAWSRPVWTGSRPNRRWCGLEGVMKRRADDIWQTLLQRGMEAADGFGGGGCKAAVVGSGWCRGRAAADHRRKGRDPTRQQRAPCRSHGKMGAPLQGRGRFWSGAIFCSCLGF